jgi:pSer/pThr/pTyr-binding forkhead associated (FHA) protein
MSFESALQLFRTACGLGAPLSLVCQDASSSAGAYTPLDHSRPFLLVGRLPLADLSLNNTQISRRHAYLQAIEGRVSCIDLESRTKTYWDGREVAQSRGWLDPGHFIQVGPYRIHRTDRQLEELASSEALDPFAPWDGEASGRDSPPRAGLELPMRAGGQSSTWSIEGLLALVGRSERCQFVLADDSVSQYHACLVRTPLGIWVVDLVAREGVHVNGTRVRWAWLAEGDLIRIGLFTFVLRYENPPEGITREDVPLEAGASPSGPPAVGLELTTESPDRNRRGLAVRREVPGPSLVGDRPPLHAVAPGPPSGISGGEWEPVLGPGSNPLALWQQQMQLMEAFHNDMIMMVQMFIAMHREHLASVRDELDHVQKLTRELTRLNARLGRVPESAEATPAGGAGAGSPRRERRPAPPAGPSQPQARPRPRTAEQPTTKRPQGRPPDAAGKTGPADRAAPHDQDAGSPRTGPPPVKSSEDLYADLTRRITELQRERQGYWQRVLKTISG